VLEKTPSNIPTKTVPSEANVGDTATVR